MFSSLSLLYLTFYEICGVLSAFIAVNGAGDRHNYREYLYILDKTGLLVKNKASITAGFCIFRWLMQGSRPAGDTSPEQEQ
jgi:hypothetical protein